ncbi:MAG: prenyltransferase/squalene oxidase repeat-containing protein [Candidatus Thorarchaeota archaeon]
MGTKLHYDYQNYLLSNGTVADKLRMVSAGFEVPSGLVDDLMNEVKLNLNQDGGIPFGVSPGSPSSVKETAEILALIAKYKREWPEVIAKMVEFLISRQKKDGGFGESLKIDPYIEDKWGAIGRAFYPVAKSVTWLTGKALEALCLVDYDNEERIRRARDFLLYNQYEDGNWPDFKDQETSDPLATGNILSGLRAAGVNSDNEVYKDGRAALYQHLKNAIEVKSTFDMADLLGAGVPETELEKEVIQSGIVLIVQSQNDDGGWVPLGSKKSDPELSSILAFVVKKERNLLKRNENE